MKRLQDNIETVCILLLVCMCVHVSVRVFVFRLSVHMAVCVSVHMAVRVFVRVCLTVRLCVGISARMSDCPFLCWNICAYVLSPCKAFIFSTILNFKLYNINLVLSISATCTS